MKKLKILLVDSSVVTRMTMIEYINSTEYGAVEKAASNGSIALEWLEQCEIDIVLIDVMIVSNEGFDLLAKIKSIRPEIEIIIMSSHSPESPSITFDSLKAGAMDFIQKPPEKEFGKCQNELKARLKELFMQIILRKFSGPAGSDYSSSHQELTSDKDSAINSKISGNIDLILIASSTGGPVALDVIFSTLPQEIYKPILIVQHMPPEFTNLMAQMLNKKYHMHFTEGKDKELIRDGHIIIAPGGLHMALEASEGLEKVIRLLDTDFVNGVKPSADVLFQSVADTCKGKNILAVILTGMGNDGTQGVNELKKNCNCYCITQSESSCVVYGMPKCVYDAGLSDEVVDLKDIAYRIHQIVLERKGR